MRKRALCFNVSRADPSDPCIKSIFFFTVTEKHAKYDKFWVGGAVPRKWFSYTGNVGFVQGQ